MNRLDDRLFDFVRDLIRDLAGDPAGVDDVAAALAVTNIQAEMWVARLMEEGVLEKGPAENSFVARAGSVPP